MDDEGGDALLEIKHYDSAAKKIEIIFLEWHGIWNTSLLVGFENYYFL